MVGTLTLAERAAKAKAEQVAEFERRREAAEQRRLEELAEAAQVLVAAALPVLRDRFGVNLAYELVPGAPLERDRVYVQPLDDESVVFAIVRRGDEPPHVYLAEWLDDTAGPRWGYTQVEVRNLVHLAELLDERTRPKGDPVDDVPATAAGEAALEAGAAAVTPSGA